MGDEGRERMEKGEEGAGKKWTPTFWGQGYAPVMIPSGMGKDSENDPVRPR